MGKLGLMPGTTETEIFSNSALAANRQRASLPSFFRISFPQRKTPMDAAS